VQPPEGLAARLGVPVESIIKLDANENPYGPSPKALAALAAHRSYHIYPDPAQHRLRARLGEYTGYPPEWILVGAGSDEMLELLVRLFVPPDGAILSFPPTFGMFSFLAGVLVGGQATINVERRTDFSLDLPLALEAARRAHLIFAVSPNNPTGTMVTPAELEALLATGRPVVIDEAYTEFADESYVGLVRERSNLIVTRTLSKWAGLAGLRVGYMIAPPPIVDLAQRIKQPYSVNVAAEVAATASFDDLPLLQNRVQKIVAERGRLAEMLSALPGFQVTPSRANFLLCRLHSRDAGDVHAALAQRGIMVRYFDTPLLHNHLRISAGTPAQDDALVSTLREILAAGQGAATAKVGKG
jgi:histidinol-phosphate aminotransferase